MKDTAEARVVKAMLDGEAPSVLMTDGYKFSMGQAGFPLRPEVFYLSFRRPGRYFIPFDLNEIIQHLLPRTVSRLEAAYLESVGYGLTPAMEEALRGAVTVKAAPKGSWVREREPILTVSGPSFLVSWLEPMVIWLQYPIQVATAVMLDEQTEFTCTCMTERTIASEAIKATGKPGFANSTADRYFVAVNQAAKDLVAAAKGDTHRLMEVGMRGATCMEMHEEALTACKAAGIYATSNVYLARLMSMKPIGTAGHEHQQRWGSDIAAFRAIRDMRPQMPSFLFDTFNADRGIQNAIDAAREIDWPNDPKRACSVRFDSGDRDAQFKTFVMGDKAYKLGLTYVFMDSITDKAVEHFEELATEQGIPHSRCVYGAGGFLVGKPAPTPYTRDRVSAVYKLCKSGDRPTMKFSTEVKQSIPGEPVIFRRIKGLREPPFVDGRYTECAGLIGQSGEAAPWGFSRLTGPDDSVEYEYEGKIGYTLETTAMIDALRGGKKG